MLYIRRLFRLCSSGGRRASLSERLLRRVKWELGGCGQKMKQRVVEVREAQLFERNRTCRFSAECRGTRAWMARAPARRTYAGSRHGEGASDTQARARPAHGAWWDEYMRRAEDGGVRRRRLAGWRRRAQERRPAEGGLSSVRGTGRRRGETASAGE